MPSNKHIRFDWAIKRLLRQKSNFGILEGFLSELLMQDIFILEIIESESNKQHEKDKSNRVDVLVKSTSNELMLIEVQNEKEHDFFHRMNYGQAKLTTEHIYAGNAYGQIKKVYSVNIVYFELGQGKDYIYKGKTEFKGIHKKDTLSLSGSQRKAYKNIKEVADIFTTYYIIKVNNFDDIAKNTLDEWIYFLKNSDIKKEFKAKGLQEAKEKMRVDNLEGYEKEAYEIYIKNQRIAAAVFETAVFDARLEVEKELIPIIEQGKREIEKIRQEVEQKQQEVKQKQQEVEQKQQKIEQERQKAEQERQNFINLVNNLKKDGFSVEKIAELTGKNIKEIDNIQQL